MYITIIGPWKAERAVFFASILIIVLDQMKNDSVNVLFFLYCTTNNVLILSRIAYRQVSEKKKVVYIIFIFISMPN